jgi:hypothetical protein
MSLKEALTNSLLMFVAATCVVLIVKAVSPTQVIYSNAGGNPAAQNRSEPTVAMQDGYKVYYLHGSVRCPTCRTIEVTAQEAVETGFADELKNGQVQWQVINYESPGNEHFTRDYEVVAPTVVLARQVAGKQTHWKALPEVWELVDDKPGLISFVQNSLREFMGQPASTAPGSNLLRSATDSEDPSSLPIPD